MGAEDDAAQQIPPAQPGPGRHGRCAGRPVADAIAVRFLVDAEYLGVTRAVGVRVVLRSRLRLLVRVAEVLRFLVAAALLAAGRARADRWAAVRDASGRGPLMLRGPRRRGSRRPRSLLPVRGRHRPSVGLLLPPLRLLRGAVVPAASVPESSHAFERTCSG